MSFELVQGRFTVMAHSLETNKMVPGGDITAIIDQAQGPLINGRVFKAPDFMAELANCHELVAIDYQTHQTVPVA